MCWMNVYWILNSSHQSFTQGETCHKSTLFVCAYRTAMAYLVEGKWLPEFFQKVRWSILVSPVSFQSNFDIHTSAIVSDGYLTAVAMCKVVSGRFDWPSTRLRVLVGVSWLTELTLFQISNTANKLYSTIWSLLLLLPILTCLTSFLMEEEEEENRLKRDGRGCWLYSSPISFFFF